MSNFIPDQPAANVEVPYFEDATTELGIKGHTTTKTILALKAQITASMGRLEAGVISMESGKFETNPERIGYQIIFSYYGGEGRMAVAALPLKNKPTEKKKMQSLKQALFSVNAALEAQYLMTLLSPGSAPLMQYMLVPGTDKTFVEVLQEQERLPALESGSMVIDAEWIVDD